VEAVRVVVQTIYIGLDLDEPDRFRLPASNKADGTMTVQSLNWEINDKQSHPITAKATDSNGVPWALSLRWADLPDPVRQALLAATERGDVPTLTDYIRSHQIIQEESDR
jgi:hypothetical protein